MDMDNVIRPLGRRVIVTGHPGAVEWLLQERPELKRVPVTATADIEIVRGREVFGNIPMDLAVHADTVWAIIFEGPPPRGKELSAEDMRAAGARLLPFVVLPGTREEILLTIIRKAMADGCQAAPWVDWLPLPEEEEECKGY